MTPTDADVQTWTPRIDWIGHDNDIVVMAAAKGGMWVSLSDYNALRAAQPAQEYETCLWCAGTGLVLNSLGDPDECSKCHGNTVAYVAAQADEQPLLDYDAGMLNDFGGGNVEWWQDYLRAEIGRANDYWRSALARGPRT